MIDIYIYKGLYKSRMILILKLTNRYIGDLIIKIIFLVNYSF